MTDAPTGTRRRPRGPGCVLDWTGLKWRRFWVGPALGGAGSGWGRSPDRPVAAGAGVAHWGRRQGPPTPMARREKQSCLAAGNPGHARLVSWWLAYFNDNSYQPWYRSIALTREWPEMPSPPGMTIGIAFSICGYCIVNPSPLGPTIEIGTSPNSGHFSVGKTSHFSVMVPTTTPFGSIIFVPAGGNISGISTFPTTSTDVSSPG